MRNSTHFVRSRTIIRLTPRMIKDVGRARAASVLPRLRDSNGEDSAGIAVMPSLISLSRDFFSRNKGGGRGGGGGRGDTPGGDNAAANPPDSWPVGPQGAPVPLHLVLC